MTRITQRGTILVPHDRHNIFEIAVGVMLIINVIMFGLILVRGY